MIVGCITCERLLTLFMVMPPASTSHRGGSVCREFQWNPSQMIKSLSYILSASLCALPSGPVVLLDNTVPRAFVWCGEKKIEHTQHVFLYSFHPIHSVASVNIYICWFIYGVAHTFIIFRRAVEDMCTQLEMRVCSKWQTIASSEIAHASALPFYKFN